MFAAGRLTMNNRSALLQQLSAAASLEQARAAAERYAQRGIVPSYAPSTRSAYASDWRIFIKWCRDVDQAALPATPETVALFIAVQANDGYAPPTLVRRLSAIRCMHHRARHASPHDCIQVVAVLRGVFAAHGPKSLRRKRAVRDAEIHRMADAADTDTLQGLRDRAVVLLGFASGLRRSELVSLDAECVQECGEGLSVRSGRRYCGENGGGEVINIPRMPDSRYCPVQALWAWRAAAHIGRGALFRRVRRGDVLSEGRLTGKSVTLLIKRLAWRAGLNPSHYAAHSLRAGFLKGARRQPARLSIAGPIG